MCKLCKSALVNITAILLFLVSLSSCIIISRTQEIAPNFADGKTVIVGMTLPASTTTLSDNSTETSIPTRTATLKRTATPLPSPTWTSIPTLQELQAKELINKLLVENANCELPCIWGMVPGTTSWYEAQQFLSSFMEYQGQNGNPRGSMEVDYGSRESVDNVQISISVKNYNILGFHLSPPGTAIRYRLDEILTRYGVPDAVFIGTYPNSPVNNFLPFDMILYYPNYSFSVLYNYNAKKIGDHLQVCPSDQPIGPELQVWDPKVDYPLDKMYPDYFKKGSLPMLSVDEALGIDVDQFTIKYKSKNSSNCFNTKIDSWQ